MPFTKAQMDALTSELPSRDVWRGTVALVEGQEKLLERMRVTASTLLAQRDAAAARVAELEAAVAGVLRDCGDGSDFPRRVRESIQDLARVAKKPEGK